MVKRKNKKKYRKRIFWTILIILLIGSSIFVYSKITKENEDITIGVRYFKNGEEVNQQKSFWNLFQQTIITPDGGSYDQFAFDIYGTNTGGVPIYDIQIQGIGNEPCLINDCNVNIGTAFFTNLQLQTLAVTDENKLLFSSNLIDAAQYEGFLVNFIVNIEGKNEHTDEIVVSWISVSLMFESEFGVYMRTFDLDYGGSIGGPGAGGWLMFSGVGYCGSDSITSGCGSGTSITNYPHNIYSGSEWEDAGYPPRVTTIQYYSDKRICINRIIYNSWGSPIGSSGRYDTQCVFCSPIIIFESVELYAGDCRGG